MDFQKNKDILLSLLDKDGLVPTSELVGRQGRPPHAELFLREHPEVQVFPAPSIWSITPLLLSDPLLWSCARLEVELAPAMAGRVTIFGVNFQRAVEQALKQGHIKSKFQIPMPDRFKSRGFVAELIVHVGTHSEQDRIFADLEAWEDVGQTTEVFYLHGRIDVNSGAFVHLDGASIHLLPDIKSQLFRTGRKLKGPYRKHFRLDCRIEAQVAYHVAKAFFPIDELVDEYFLERVLPAHSSDV